MTQPDFDNENENPNPAPEQPAAPATDESAARIAALEAEVAGAKDQALRALAELENTRKRSIRERDDAAKYASSNFARDMLDFTDNFHRALSAIPAELREDARIASVISGIEAMEKVLARTFEKHGITKLEPLGAAFDANYHEVIFEIPDTGKPAGIIIQVIEPGYMLKERLLRPARVGVAKGDGVSKVDTTA